MATPDSDMEKIRLKRLAKLQSSSQAPSPSLEQASSSTASPKTVPEPVVELVPSATPPRVTTPQSKRGMDVPPNDASPATKPKPSPASPQRKPATPQTIEDWEDKVLSSIFRITVQPQAPMGEQKGYYFLEKLQAELEGEGEPVRLSVGILDQAILSICSSSYLTTKPFDYLLGCWKRAAYQQRNLRPSEQGNGHKMIVLAEAKRIAMCYASYCITMPEMFEDVDASIQLEDKLVLDLDDEAALPVDFFNGLVNQFEEDSAMEEAFAAAIERLSQKLNSVDFSMNYKPYLIALMKIASVKPLAKLLIDSPLFLPADITASTIETNTLLGPFFKLSPLQPKVLDMFFSGIKTRPPQSLSDATKALRLALQTSQDQLFQIINTLVRSSPEARNKVLDYFAQVVNLNQKRAAIQVEPATIASDGFMLNITAILARLSEPFMDAGLTKLGRAEVEYLRRSPRLGIEGETKVNADEATSSEYYKNNQMDGESNFITEIYFLAVAAHHYGLGATMTTHEQLARDIDEMEKHLEKLQAERAKWLNSPQLAVYDRNLERLRERIDKGHGYKFGLDIILYDPIFQARTLLFMRFQAAWILRLVSQDRSYPYTPISLPLPETPPDDYSNLPEYFVENVGLIYSFLGRHLPHIVISTQVEELVIFCITFLRNSTYIHNPHLKSRLVEILFYGIQPNRAKPNGMLGDVINGHKFALQHLMHALMNFYIEIESQYYQKFTVRYHISEIIKRMWDNHSYRDKLELESRLNPDFFIRFVALLLNDATYVMDNSLTALVDIHRLQHELEPANSLTPQERTDKEKALAKAERDASSYVTLGNETVAMLKLFTAALADAFTQPEIVHRLAGMLNYNLDTLVGPRCSTLKVKNPEKYGFQPKVLLVGLSEVYLNLRHKQAFVEGIAKDGRSYRPEIFERLLNLLARFELRSKEERDEIAKLAREVEEVKKKEEEGEEELGEVPDEFLDPLMATLMEDPVILPSSRVTVDRGTIKTHLLSDPKDPFNRAPLKIEDVIPNTELKGKITAFIQERRSLRIANAATQEMDIDT